MMFAKEYESKKNGVIGHQKSPYIAIGVIISGFLSVAFCAWEVLRRDQLQITLNEGEDLVVKVLGILFIASLIALFIVQSFLNSRIVHKSRQEIDVLKQEIKDSEEKRKQEIKTIDQSITALQQQITDLHADLIKLSKIEEKQNNIQSLLNDQFNTINTNYTHLTATLRDTQKEIQQNFYFCNSAISDFCCELLSSLSEQQRNDSSSRELCDKLRYMFEKLQHIKLYSHSPDKKSNREITIHTNAETISDRFTQTLTPLTDAVSELMSQQLIHSQNDVRTSSPVSDNNTTSDNFFIQRLKDLKDAAKTFVSESANSKQNKTLKCATYSKRLSSLVPFVAAELEQIVLSENINNENLSNSFKVILPYRNSVHRSSWHGIILFNGDHLDNKHLNDEATIQFIYCIGEIENSLCIHEDNALQNKIALIKEKTAQIFSDTVAMIRNMPHSPPPPLKNATVVVPRSPTTTLR